MNNTLDIAPLLDRLCKAAVEEVQAAIDGVKILPYTEVRKDFHDEAGRKIYRKYVGTGMLNRLSAP